MKPTTVSLFCGAGGESLGKHAALTAMGMEDHQLVAHAVNHWALAVQAHGRNLPWVNVHQEDILEVTAATYGLDRIHLLWASPSCVHHSRARGGKPREDQQRAHAWEVTDRWLKVAHVDVVLIENVPEFMEWGPLHDTHTAECRDANRTAIRRRFEKARKGQTPEPYLCANGCHHGQPIKERKGEFFRAWVQGLRDLGYEVDWRVLCAADFGAPTTRRRFFLQATRDGKGIHWPEPTHRDPRKPAGLFDAAMPTWRTAAECIDWSIPVPSIFGRKRPLAEATLRRIAAGVARYVLQGRPFLVNLSHGGRLEDLDEPLRTVTAEPKGGDRALVAFNLMTNTTGHAPTSATAPVPALTTGNHQALVAAFLSTYHGARPGEGEVARGSAQDAPTPTMATAKHHALVAASLIQTGYGEREGQAPRCLDIQAPLGTVVAEGQKHGLVAAFISHYYGQGTTAQDPADPLHTVTTLARHGLVTVDIDGETCVITDIGMRMLEPKELARAMGFPDTYDWSGFTKRDQVKMIGNAVPPPVARALVEAVLRPRPELMGLEVVA